MQRSTLTDPAKLARFIDAGTKYLTVDESFDMGAMRSMMLELRELGMTTMREDGVRAILNGETTMEEVLKYT